MPHGCWIDLYETADLTGERRRLFGPIELDAFVWSRFADADAVSVRVGPGAAVVLVENDGTERRLPPDATDKAIVARAIRVLSVLPAVNLDEEEVDESRPVIRREVGDPPALPTPRRRRRHDQVHDEPAASGADDDGSS